MHIHITRSVEVVIGNKDETNSDLPHRFAIAHSFGVLTHHACMQHAIHYALQQQRNVHMVKGCR